ncbi:MAG: CcdB family protein [Pseudomonadota bacterium]
MARYDVYRAAEYGYLLDVQADIIGDLNVHAVVPLMPLDIAPKPAKRLNPIFDLGEAPHSMVTQYISSVPKQTLGAPVMNLSERGEDVTAALDMLFQGF